MPKWIAIAWVRSIVSALAFALIGMAVVVTNSSNSFAQDKKAAQKKNTQKEQQQKDQQKGQQPQSQAPQLTFSPWTKVCLKEEGKSACFTGKEGRVESGQPVVAAVLIEPEGEPRKLLRVTLPLGMALPPGTRAIVDQGQPMTAPYVICFISGCMADYEATQALVDMMKKGQGLVIQGISGGGQAVSLALPLDDFAKAHDGPPTDPKEIQRRDEELRKKLEAHPKY